MGFLILSCNQHTN